MAGKIDDTIDLEKELVKMVDLVISKMEPVDVEEQCRLFDRWDEERQALVDTQVEQLRTTQRKRKIAERLLTLKSREERLRFFERQSKMDLIISMQPKIKPIEDVVEEELFVAPPGERGRGSGDVAKKAR